MGEGGKGPGQGRIRANKARGRVLDYLTIQLDLDSR